MKILLCSDMHGSLDAFEQIRQKSQEVDLIVCAGDITLFEKDIDFFIRMFSELGKEVIIIHGNHEDAQLMEMLCSRYNNLHFIHKQKKKIEDILFIGYGGGGFSFKDSQLKGMERKMESWIKEHKSGKVVLISHGPPYGTKLDKLDMGHVGNITLREFIVKYQMDLLVCGHIHENAGKRDKIKKTVLIYPHINGEIIEI